MIAGSIHHGEPVEPPQLAVGNGKRWVSGVEPRKRWVSEVESRKRWVSEVEPPAYTGRVRTCFQFLICQLIRPVQIRL